MAVDRNRLRPLVKDIDDLFNNFPVPLAESQKNWVREKMMGPALEELRKLIDDSRPPILMLVGRSGHGKSSILNALAGKKVVEVGVVRPQTPEASALLIHFPEKFASWSIIDTRGIFETSPPDGAPDGDATAVLKQEIMKRKPDVILHVISTPEVRALSNDLRVMSEIIKELSSSAGGTIPRIVVLSRPDTLGNPREWPPETYQRKAAQLLDCMDYFVSDALKIASSWTNIDANAPFRGRIFPDNEANSFAVLPIFALEEDAPWNIENLARLIGKNLPESAKLDFYQAQGRQRLLRELSTSIINRFSSISGVIGAAPIPFSDMAIIGPLQLLMIAIIAGLSCRQPSIETAIEYLSASGVNVSAGFGLREIARQIIKLIPAPIATLPISAGVAAMGTRALGKAAEVYFFGTSEVKTN